MSKDLSVKYMKAHLVFLNKQLRKELILSGVAKMKRNDLEKNFKDRFESTTNKKDGSIYYLPKNKYGDIEADEDDFKDLNNKLSPKKKDPKKEPKKVKKSELKKKKEKPKPTTLLENLKKLVNKYNKDEIKKQKLTKENLKKYTNPYFDLSEKIEKQLKEVDDPMEFLKKNKELSKKYADVSKNFIRRINAQMKANKKK